MPDPTARNGATSLPQRFDMFAKAVEGIVLRGAEHPACELKRTVTLSKDDLADRLDFVKLIQGLANSHAGTECLIVIGADQKEKEVLRRFQCRRFRRSEDVAYPSEIPFPGA